MPPAPKRAPLWIGLLLIAAGSSLLTGIAVFSRVVPLPRGVDRHLLPPAAILGACVLVFVGMLVLSALGSRRDAAMLDAVFGGLGLTGGWSLIGWARYRGVFAGRPIEARYKPAARYAPPWIDIRVGASPRTALAVELRRHHGTRFGAIEGGHEVSIEDPRYEHLVAQAPDAARAGRALRDPAVMEAILRTFRDPPGMPSITITPDAVSLRVMAAVPEALDASIARAWVSDLVALAHVVEALPPL